MEKRDFGISCWRGHFGFGESRMETTIGKDLIQSSCSLTRNILLSASMRFVLTTQPVTIMQARQALHPAARVWLDRTRLGQVTC